MSWPCRPSRPIPPLLALLLPLALVPAPGVSGDEPKAGARPLPIAERGTSIVACGRKVDIGTPVILWTDPGGHDAYAPAPGPDEASADAGRKGHARGFGFRRVGLDPALVAEAQKEGWTLPTLQRAVDQFVIHYDASGTSEGCFRVLRQRHLGVHFLLDLDGTIYQTLDLEEAAYHATKANSRSVGVEIANMGAYPPETLVESPLARWYARDDSGQTRLTLPEGASVPTLDPGAAPLRPSRPEPITGVVQGRTYAQYDLTPEQYEALARLTAGLCATFPRIRRDAPRDGQGRVLDHALDDRAYASYRGILGHYHVQANKQDPGPAFHWDRILGRSPAPTPAK